MVYRLQQKAVDSSLNAVSCLMKSIFSNKPFLFILITGFLSVMGIGIIIPVTPFIVSKFVDPRHLDLVAVYVGLLMSTYSVFQFFAAPVLGAISDKFGRRPILLLCLFGSGIGYILYGIGGSIAVLFVSRIIDGITGGDISTAFAYVADVTPPQDRGKYFGVLGATIGLGFILGPSIGGLLSHISLSTPLFVSAGLAFVNMIYGYFVLPESLDKSHRMSDFTIHHLNPFVQIQYIFNKPLLKSLMFTGFFYFLAFAELQAITTVFYKDTLNWLPANLGIFFLVLGAGDIFTQGYLTGKLLPKFGALKLVAGGFVVTAIAYMLNGILPIFPFAFLAIGYGLIYALGSGLFEPSFSGLVSATAEHHEQGRTQGASTSMQSVARIVGPLLAAFLYQFGHSLPWISCALFSFVGVLLLWKNKEKVMGLNVTRGH